ncbi:hypothetical protein SARC_17591, partial [Sphaeroforma arctica JP610]
MHAVEGRSSTSTTDRITHSGSDPDSSSDSNHDNGDDYHDTRSCTTYGEGDGTNAMRMYLYELQQQNSDLQEV